MNPAWSKALLGAALVLACALRFHALDMPLERDEGAFAYIAERMLAGEAPYKDAVDVAPPGVFYAYALILSLFGASPVGIHAGLLLANLLTIVLLHLAAERRWGAAAGAAAGLAYAVLSADLSVKGLWTYNEHFVALFVSAGVCALLARRAALAGACFGAAVLMKHHALFFVPAGALFARLGGFSMLRFGAGVLAPLLVSTGALAWQGALEDAWFWTARYALWHGSSPPEDAPWRLKENAGWGLRAAPLLWSLAGAGLLLRRDPLLWLLGAASLAALCPGLFFRRHYFIMALPFAALAAGAALAWLHERLGRRLGPRPALGGCAALLLAALAQPVWGHAVVFTNWDHAAVMGWSFGPEPFRESTWIAEQIRARTRPEDRMIVFGSEPQLYLLSGRRAATRFVTMYQLMPGGPGVEGRHEELLRDLRTKAPRIVVYVNSPGSWGAWPEPLIEKARSEVRARYRLVAAVDIVSPARSDYHRGHDARRWRPHTAYWVAVFERADS